MIIYAPVQTDKTKESLVEIKKEIQGILTDRPVTAAELASIQANETLELPGLARRFGSVGTSIIDILQYGWPDNYYDTMAGKIRALETSDLDAAAKRSNSSHRPGVVDRRDRAKIEAVLES